MIEIKVDARRAVGFLSDMAERQLPFALSKALNATGLEIQKAERRQLRRVFTLRRPDWADRSVKITHFAKKREPWLTIGIHPPGATGASRADVLAKFETDREKLPKQGTIAIPVSRIGVVRRKSTGIIPKRNHPRQLLDGSKKGVFLVRRKIGRVGEGLILQRVSFGSGKNRRSSVVALYYLVRRARLQPVLQFLPTASSTVDAEFPTQMTRALDDALRTAK